MCFASELNMFRPLLLIAIMGLALPAYGQISSEYKQVKGDDLQAVFNNTLVFSEYHNFKGINNKTYDFTEFHFEDGTTDYTEIGSKTEKGKWKIIGGDKICYKYPRTEAFPETYCFFIYQQDKCYYQYDISAMTIRGPRSWDLWTARFVRKGDGGICGEPVS